ncbi:hypothetical protein C1646_770027 [Rhizophagus diaphanus]|nr:hypothetical protein C1646_770027 [Rhizophagus diaphanus] [Rhizophagus sp. MUCL 43196]
METEIYYLTHLNLYEINSIINNNYSKYKNKISFIKNEIFNILINKDTKFTHLYLPQRFDYQIHLILGAKQSLSKIVSLSCYTRINDKVLIGLAEICQSIKKLELFIEERENNYGITKLIDASKTLINVRLITDYVFYNRNLFVNTNGNLIKIGIDDIPYNEIDNKNIIQAIYQNCPNLMYLKYKIRNESILELEQLLINCQYLVGLYFYAIKTFDWDELFKVLTISSPTSLIKFKFNKILSNKIKLESLKLFFDNWKGRNPISLQLDPYNVCSDLIDLIGEYKLEGIINKFDYLCGTDGRYYFEDFEW